MFFATIGTSRITDQFIEASKEAERFELGAVYSRSSSAAQAFAEKHQAPKFFDSLENMALDPSIDVIYIASPNALHMDQAIFFLKHKKHVICEKPIFTNLKEWQAAFQVAEENGVYLFEAMRTIHSPNYKKVLENIHEIKPVRSAFLHTIQYSSRYDAYLSGEVPNIFSSRFAGGALMDLGVYPLYMAVQLFGMPENVNYHPVMLKSGVDGSGTLVLDYKGFVCTILCSKIAPSIAPSEIHGENGTLIIDKVATIDTVTHFDRRKNTSCKISVDENEKNMVYEIEVFSKIILENDRTQYEALKKLSHQVLSILDQARAGSGIIFESENTQASS